MTTSKRRVVVTGLGASTPIGGDVATTWASLLAGRPGIRALEGERFAAMPVRIAGTAEVDPTEVLDRVEARKLDRCQQFALVAARQAWADAGSPEVDPLRLGVVIASGIGGITSLLDNYDILLARGPSRVSPMSVPQLMPNGAAAWVGLDLGALANLRHPFAQRGDGDFTTDDHDRAEHEDHAHGLGPQCGASAIQPFEAGNDDHGHVLAHQQDQRHRDDEFVCHRIEERTEPRSLTHAARQVAIERVGDAGQRKQQTRRRIRPLEG